MPAPTRPRGSLRFQLGQQCAASGIVVGEQGESAVEQRNGGRHVFASERSTSRGRQYLSSLGGERPSRLVGRDELGAIAVCLLEVVAEDLVVLPKALAFPSLRLEPPREALVELCAHRLGHARVRLVADQRVTEAIRVLPWQLGARRLHEPLANEAHELARHVRLVGVRREVDDGARPELLPDDRRALERPSLCRVEAVDPRGQKRMNRRGQLDRVTGLRVRDHRRKLLGEERIPLGG